MASNDIFDAASKINSAIVRLTKDESRKAILMALVSVGMDGLLVDPSQFKLVTVPRQDGLET